MIIYSNENNSSTLKLVISAKIAKKNVEIQLVKATDERVPSPKQLPVLQVSQDVNIFSSNTACAYLLASSGSWEMTLECSQLLEWESTSLVPTVTNIRGPKAVAVDAAGRLIKLIAELNGQLQGKKYILGDKLSAADISLWCTLYSVFSDAELSKQFLSDSSGAHNLKSWHGKIAALPEVKESLKEYPLKCPDLCQMLDSTSITGAHVLPAVTAAAKGSTEVNASSTPTNSPDLKLEVAVTEEELRSAEDFWNNGQNPLKDKLPDEKIVLPKEGYKNILITSALPYVNNVPHLGNIIGCVLSADVFARYCRLCNYNTLFVCGTDEYGTATETKALEEGITPRQICDKYFEIHNSVYRWFRIGFDYFGRTTTPEQTEIVQKMFLDLYKNGFVNTQTVEQLLCEGCNRFLADRFVEGMCPHPGCGYEDARGDQCDGCSKLVNATELINPRCKLCSKAPVLRESSHFFLDLPQLEPLLQTWVAASEAGWSNSAQQITRAWLKIGLRSRCITRDLSWGVPVPVDGFRDKVFYVWFDAPIGYISITKRYTDQYEKWWKPDPKHNVTLYQFMAKDNVPFHSVVFPATLLGIGQKNVMVKHIMATEYLNYEDGKFSKSRGVGVFGSDAQDTGIPADVFRFYLISIRPEGQDSNFCWHDLATRNNSELLNNLGNFVNRSTMFCANSFAGVVPAVHLEEQDLKLLALVNREMKSYVESMEACKQRDALRHVLNISRLGNQYMQSQQPWVLLKGTDDAKTRAGTVVALSVNLSCLLGVLLHPFMPETSHTLLAQLGTKLDEVGRTNPECPSLRRLLPSGHRIGTPSPLFQKLEADRVEELKRRYAGRQASPPKEVKVEGLTAEELERKILEQGEKVRLLKASGAEKATWQPEVQILLALKKKLAGDDGKKPAANEGKMAGGGAKKEGKKEASVERVQVASDAKQIVSEIEAEIVKQGEKVRTLKSGGGDKSVWQPEVDLLLSLKKKLTQALEAAGITVVAPEPKATKSKKAGKKNK